MARKVEQTGAKLNKQQRAEALAEQQLDEELGEPTEKMSPAEKKAWDAWAEKDRRARYGQLPKPPEEGDVELLYAKLRTELADFNDGEVVLAVMATNAWQSTVGARCAELDAAADSRRSYSAYEFEKAMLYQRLNGKRTYKAARKELAGDAGSHVRAALGFDVARDHVPNRRLKRAHKKLLDGVPSGATISRWKKYRFPERERADLYAEFFIRLVEEHAGEFAEFRDELRVLGADGSTHKSIWKPGWKKDKDGNYLADENGERIPRVPGWEGGSLTAESAPESKRGHGFMTTTVHTGTGLPVAARSVRIHDSEIDCLLDMTEKDFPRLRAAMGNDDIGVISLDGFYSGPRVRKAVRRHGYLENTHRVSHGDKAATQRNLERHLNTAIPIEGHPNWRANGLRELFCMCGGGDTYARPRMLTNGTVSISVEGKCAKCGPIHITSGDWRRAQNPDRFVMVNPNDDVEVSQTDLLLGNPLTHQDKRALAYGKNRYAQGEGLHGTAATRFNLFKDKAYYRRIDQVRIDVNMTYGLMHVLAMLTRRQRQQTAEPPPTPLRPPAPAQLAA